MAVRFAVDHLQIGRTPGIPQTWPEGRTRRARYARLRGPVASPRPFLGGRSMKKAICVLSRRGGNSKRSIGEFLRQPLRQNMTSFTPATSLAKKGADESDSSVSLSRDDVCVLSGGEMNRKQKKNCPTQGRSAARNAGDRESPETLERLPRARPRLHAALWMQLANSPEVTPEEQ